jgi:(S)-2-hydroxyglutarate dehydrogenase
MSRMAESVGVIGGGIVGLAVARELLTRNPGMDLVVVEKEHALARHQTGRNSGVVHAGLYYKPGSLRATLCQAGGRMLSSYCAARGLPFDRCGKLVVALDDDEAESLRSLQARAIENGLTGVRLVSRSEMAEIEPHVQGVLGLFSPTTAVVDFVKVAEALADDVVEAGGTIRLGTEIRSVHNDGAARTVRAELDDGEILFDWVVICAGLHGDQLAISAGDVEDPRIVPFRGEYFELVEGRRDLVRALVYPVPKPQLPFLGVHFTRHVDGSVSVGPNAVLALAREGYRKSQIDTATLLELLRYEGFRKMARTYWASGLSEFAGSASRRLYLRRAQRYIPELQASDLGSRSAGIRAQAVDRNGQLVDDFVVHRRGRVVAIRNAPSPAATASLAIASYVCDEFLEDLPLNSV